MLRVVLFQEGLNRVLDSFKFFLFWDFRFVCVFFIIVIVFKFMYVLRLEKFDKKRDVWVQFKFNELKFIVEGFGILYFY